MVMKLTLQYSITEFNLMSPVIPLDKILSYFIFTNVEIKSMQCVMQEEDRNLGSKSIIENIRNVLVKHCTEK